MHKSPIISKATVTIIVLSLLTADVSGVNWLLFKSEGHYGFMFYLSLISTSLTLYDVVGLSRLGVVPTISDKELARVNRFICALAGKIIVTVSMLTLV